MKTNVKIFMQDAESEVLRNASSNGTWSQPLIESLEDVVLNGKIKPKVKSIAKSTSISIDVDLARMLSQLSESSGVSIAQILTIAKNNAITKAKAQAENKANANTTHKETI